MTELPSGYLALPEAGGPGVLVLHAWWGLNRFFTALCDRLAGAGFVAFAPDLYHGALATTIPEAKRLRSALDRTIVNKELSGAVRSLRTHPAVRGPALGVVGFSLGGNWALWTAEHHPEAIGAAVLFYGTGGGRFSKAQATFLGHFAEHDTWGTGPQSVGALEERLRAAGREVSFYTYPGAQHWFAEDDRTDAYDAAAAGLAWERTIAFLHAQLG